MAARWIAALRSQDRQFDLGQETMYHPKNPTKNDAKRGE
jgi:hypothetical protein